jgi:hypothetical protein
MADVFKVCDQVPNGSTLKIDVDPAEGAYTTQVDFAISNSAPESFPHDQVVPEGVRKVLESPNAYVVSIHIHCLGEVKVTVSTRVVDPQGTEVCAHDFEVECDGAGSHLFVLIVRTRREQGGA